MQRIRTRSKALGAPRIAQSLRDITESFVEGSISCPVEVAWTSRTILFFGSLELKLRWQESIPINCIFS